MRKNGLLILIFMVILPLFADKIHDAAIKGDIELLKKELAKGVNINLQDDDDCSVIMYAIKSDQTKAVKFLLENGANLNLKTKYGDTSLIFAANNGNIDIVNLIINTRVDVNERNDLGETALMEASLQGYTKIVKRLVEKGANINARSKDFSSAIMRGAFKGYVDIVMQLLEKGADPKIKDDKKKSAKDYAKKKGYQDIVTLLEDWQKNPQKVINNEKALQRHAPKGIMKYKLIDLEIKKEISKGTLNIIKIDIENKNISNDEEKYFEDRYLKLFDDFVIGQSNYGKKDRKNICGFGMWLKHLNYNTFSWEWYEQIDDNVFKKLQGEGEIRVEFRKRNGYFEISKMIFIGDQIFRAKKRNLFTLVTNPEKEDWHCIILNGSYIVF